MPGRRLQVLIGHLSTHPEDPPAWLELAHWALRLGQLPDFLRPTHLAYLLAAWQLAPRDRSLLPLFLAAAGLELPPSGPAPRASWWTPRRRLTGEEGETFDRLQGVPLRVIEKRTGSELVWVTGGASGRGSLRHRLSGKARRWLGSYLGRHPLTVGSYQEFLRATGHPAPSDHQEKIPWTLQQKAPERPVVFVSHADAEECCRWLGGQLPEDALWTFAARGPGTRPFPWGNATPGSERARFNHGVPWRGGDWDRFLGPVGERPEGASPFGVEDLAGHVREWTKERIRDQDQWKARVRGGSWGASRPEQLWIDHPEDLQELPRRQDDVGFRLAMPIFRWEPDLDPGAETSAPRPTRRERQRRKRQRRRRRARHTR